MTDWRATLRTVAPRGKNNIIAGLAASMPRVIEIAELHTPLRLAHFLAQLCHEAAGLRAVEEYASGAAYEGRRDLGNVQSGDGKRFKGRGLVQLTGRHNYKEMSSKVGVDLVADPAAAGRFPVAAITAAFFWQTRKLNQFADADNLRAVTNRINGGLNGLADRGLYLKAAKRAIGAGRRATPAVGAVPVLTVNSLRLSGSRTIAGADSIKESTAGLVIAAVSAGVAVSQSENVVVQAQDALVGLEAGAGWLDLAASYWPVPVVALATVAFVWLLWRIERSAGHVQAARLEDALAAAPFDGEGADDEDENG